MYAEDLLDFANTKANEAAALFDPGTIVGKIVDQDDVGVANVNITYGDIYVLTGSDGSFELKLAAGTRTFSIVVDGEEEATYEWVTTAGSENDVGPIKIGEPPEEEQDLLWLYLLIIVIVIVVVIIAVVVMKKRGPSIEEEPMEEEMAPEPEPEPEMESEE